MRGLEIIAEVRYIGFSTPFGVWPKWLSWQSDTLVMCRSWVRFPVLANVIITPTPGSDITTNRKAIEGIQRLVRLAANVLQDENIVITDNRGNILNAFIFESGFKPQGPGGVSSNVPLLSCLGQRNLGIYAILANTDLKEQQSHR